MSFLKVGGASLNQIPMDWEGNRRRIFTAVMAAASRGVKVLCLPELCISGYGCEDMHTSEHVIESSMDSLRELSCMIRRGFSKEDLNDDIMFCVGLPIGIGNKVYNSVCVFYGSDPIGFAVKKQLARDGVHYEPRWFEPWPEGHIVNGKTHWGDLPFGDLLLQHRYCGAKIGFEICEEAWTSNRTGGQLAARGVDIILNPSASHFEMGKHSHRRRLVMDGSRAFSCGYVYANMLGNESGKIVYDGSVLIADSGEMLAESQRFSFAEVELTWASIDIGRTKRIKRVSSGFTAMPESFIEHGSLKDVTIEYRPEMPQAVEQLTKFEEFESAVHLGLFDYLRKSGTSGYVVSLSGGADSAAVAVLVAGMARAASSQLGGRRISDIFDHVHDFRIENVLTCVYQGTRNSSDRTEKTARQIAKDCESAFHSIDIDPIVEEYKRLIGLTLDMALDWSHDWERHDIPLQNIQARARSPSAWLIANIKNSILLATGNRSESSAGYSTMDGDTSGGLAPISGVSKQFIREWLEHAKVEFPSLCSVLEQEPSAELRPASDCQTDETDLMPYPFLDVVEHLAVTEKLSPLDTFRRIRFNFPQYGSSQIVSWIDRFYTLWSRNQWKRERYAPGFHVDGRNLDPKSWCRFPILSSGFEFELGRLKKEYLDEY